MKLVNLRCTCGASITFQDEAESSINEDSSPDKQGRRFLIEVRSDEWQSRHNKCIEARIKALTSNKQSKAKDEDEE